MQLLGALGLLNSISIGIAGISVFNDLALGTANALSMPMFLTPKPTGQLVGGSTCLQSKAQSAVNDRQSQVASSVRLASADSVVRLLAQVRGFVQVATVRANGAVERRYLAGARVWQVRSRE